MPNLADLFSHVVVDVSSVKALCMRWFPRGTTFWSAWKIGIMASHFYNCNALFVHFLSQIIRRLLQRKTNIEPWMTLEKAYWNLNFTNKIFLNPRNQGDDSIVLYPTEWMFYACTKARILHYGPLWLQFTLLFHAPAFQSKLCSMSQWQPVDFCRVLTFCFEQNIFKPSKSGVMTQLEWILFFSSKVRILHDGPLIELRECIIWFGYVFMNQNLMF